MYDTGALYEDNRLRRTAVHELEFILTCDLLKTHIPEDSVVFDIGAGTGVYSEYLMNELNCKVGLVDLSKVELDLFKSKNAGILEKTLFVEECSATEIDRFHSFRFDAILIFGPLYHLVEVDERMGVIQKASKLLKEDGLLFTSHISPHKIYHDLLLNGTEKIRDEVFLEDLRKGVTYHTNSGCKAIQYRSWPSDAKREIENCGFDVVSSRSLEGVFSYVDSNHLDYLEDSNVKELWTKLARETCENQDIIGSSWHFLLMSKKRLTMFST
jgi:2-polyprenyl-3-methyl-5-hydroxy-6-metoxy-1,4-benzoquinol methylase